MTRHFDQEFEVGRVYGFAQLGLSLDWMSEDLYCTYGGLLGMKEEKRRQSMVCKREKQVVLACASRRNQCPTECQMMGPMLLLK
jgi:nitrate/nitrite-specific signal transduction histidine kinase